MSTGVGHVSGPVIQQTAFPMFVDPFIFFHDAWTASKFREPRHIQHLGLHQEARPVYPFFYRMSTENAAGSCPRPCLGSSLFFQFFLTDEPILFCSLLSPFSRFAQLTSADQMLFLSFGPGISRFAAFADAPGLVLAPPPALTSGSSIAPPS